MSKPDRQTLFHACPYCHTRGLIQQYDMDESVEHHCITCDSVWLQWSDTGERQRMGTVTELDAIGDALGASIDD